MFQVRSTIFTTLSKVVAVINLKMSIIKNKIFPKPSDSHKKYLV